MLATLTTLVFICAPVSAPGLTLPAPQAETEAEVVVHQGYVGQILLVDALGAGIVIGSTMAESGEGIVVGLGTLAIVPAIVHLGHDRGAEALASLVLRPGLTIGGAFAGAALANDDQDGCTELCGLGEAFLGAVIGYGVAVGIDAAYLARTKRTTREANWMPTVSATSSSVQLGLGGRF